MAELALRATDVRLQGIKKSFGKDQLAVDIEAMVVPAGEFVTLLGPSGCGKTTTLKLIAGLERPNLGTIYFGDRPVTELSPGNRDIAMVFQNYALYPHMTVRDNLEYGLKKHNVPRDERQRRVAWASQMLQLDGMLQRKPRQLSGGQQQRVALGRAMVREPQVFLLDEPLSNLDARLRLQMRSELIRLHHTIGTTMIYVTHDQVEAMSMSQRIAVMRDGRIQQYDNPEAIYKYPANRFVASFIGSPCMNLFEGELESRDGGVRFVARGLDVRLPREMVGRLREEAHADNGVALGVRPEDVFLHMADAPADASMGRVNVVEELGPETLVTLEAGSGEVVTRVRGMQAIEFDRQLCFSFDPDNLHLFSLKNGESVLRPGESSHHVPAAPATSSGGRTFVHKTSSSSTS
ncbi:MAG TPA: ABC transporter ATP-binding protein [Ktedonobacterales bacterium]|nr:ABC transporter ATP-binding protein [Ktedonobacterales bacterium]